MAKKEISFRQIGQNIIVVINGTQYSRRVVEKTEREGIKKDVEIYNTKNSVKLEKSIIDFMTVDTKERNQKIKEAKSSIKKADNKPKAASKKVDREVKAKALIESKKAKVNEPKTSSYRRSGEW